MTLEASIKDRAHALGFDLVGITTAEPFPDADAAYQRWIDSGSHAAMDYMVEHRDRVGDPRRVRASARSVIAVAMNYYAGEPAPLAHCYVDTGPLLDRAIVQRAGLGARPHRGQRRTSCAGDRAGSGGGPPGD